jgi:phage tail sheath protein FI
MEVGYAVHQFFQNGGREAWFIRVGEKTGRIDVVGNRRKRTGLYALEKVDAFNLLCIPSISHLPERERHRVLTQVISYCEDRRAFLIIDAPGGIKTANGLRSWLKKHDAFRHPNVALYFPRVRIVDPEDGAQIRAVGASGAVVGVFARTDSTRGVWKAPAGKDAQLLGVVGPEYNLPAGDIASLGTFGLNPVRLISNYGSVVWGARTLMGADHLASEWKYISVRRLALFVEESIYRGTQWVVFEPNDAKLWGRIRGAVSPFMQSLFRIGAFVGAKPQQSYFVKCDNETTSQTDIRRGTVNILVGFAPLKPAEFIIIRIGHKAKPPQ